MSDRKHSPLVSDSAQHHEAVLALTDARRALVRLAALFGTDSSVEVKLSHPWDPTDPESKPSISLKVGFVVERVNRCQQMLDLREWDGADAFAIADQLARPECVCDRCTTRRRWEEQWAREAAREPLDVFVAQDVEVPHG